MKGKIEIIVNDDFSLEFRKGTTLKTTKGESEELEKMIKKIKEILK